ncbi:predicted protein [Nematostella vectensis]|uniref:Mitochondrial inner membrane protease subunit 2 n=1 Tax=Nematostella vectensis TaxID=45351 RepID=A7SSK3_NEMVE|nr:mitochondrial inner membrane protease subunit 2 isoform X2 [Nematostella vectensis]EDO33319.1 predicted protein [Nematostella vectensis]|eukprot:XP_001625419.1 predicted protein [Nematostella vectensis]
MSNFVFRYGKAFAQGLILSLPIGIVLVDNIACLATVHGSSMKPSFNTDYKTRDIVVLNKWCVKNFKGIKRGDVVSIVDPHDPDIMLIKRIVALQGDHVKAIGYKNRYVKIPRGHCWIEGDNSNHSMDSNTFGPVPVGLIQAKATHVVWPYRRWGRVENKLLKHRAPLNQSELKMLNDFEDTKQDESEGESETEESSTWNANDIDTLSDCGLVPGKFGPV